MKNFIATIWLEKRYKNHIEMRKRHIPIKGDNPHQAEKALEKEISHEGYDVRQWGWKCEIREALPEEPLHPSPWYIIHINDEYHTGKVAFLYALYVGEKRKASGGSWDFRHTIQLAKETTSYYFEEPWDQAKPFENVSPMF